MGRRLLSHLFLMCAVGTVGLSAQSPWNARVELFVSAMSLPAAGEPGIWLGEPALTSSFVQGEGVNLVRRAGLSATQAPPAWKIEIWLGSTLLESQSVPSSTSQPRAVGALAVAGAPGTYQARCKLVLQDASAADNVSAISYKVVPKMGDIAGHLLIPPPAILQPAAGARIVAGSKVQLRARVPIIPLSGQPNFAAYAARTSTEERWRLELIRLGEGPRARSTLVKRFERIVTATEFGAELTIDEPGRYLVRALVLQEIETGIRPSPAATIQFELFRPLAANQANQPVPTATTPSPKPVAKPRIPVPRERTP